MKNKKLINSFKYAINGIKCSVKEERNLKIHIFIMTLVIIFGMILRLSKLEWIICFGWFGAVIGGELFNTAVEITVDLAMPNINENAKKAKDISAGAVLVLAFFAFLTGLLIFIPKIISLF